HTSNQIFKNYNHCIDRSLNSISEEQIETFKPDVLIYLGGAIVSKKIKAFLRKHQARVHWKVGMNFPEMDTFQGMSHSFQLEEGDFVRFLNTLPKQIQSNFGLKWKQLDYLIQDKAKKYFDSANYSDLAVFNKLLDCVPDNSNLHLANSSVIRYALLFDPIASIKYWCNRGTSGIDGSTSTAVGAALMQKDSWHTLISGDMSFFYDSNAFWNHVASPNLRIFLINNGGGSIFKIIPGPDSTEEQNDFFVYNNSFQAEYLCKNFNISYFKAHNISEIDKQMEEFYAFEENGRPKVMEIFTNGIENEKILKDFFLNVKI
ncbi:MAG: 2-succinyl-5-enolpyruvyl-6-hydroxy-3-cyclohexene-1-carboxylic-acid synthase, partial [Flavobacteriia bacterium]